MRKLIIIGAGGHGKMCASIASKMNAWKSINFLDDNIRGSVLDYKILGQIEPQKYQGNDVDFFVAIGNNEIRQKILSKLIKMNINIVNLIDPSAKIDNQVTIDKGTVVMPGSIINTSTKIGFGVIVNTGTIIDHDCKISDYTHLSPGVNIAGNVKIGCNTWLGIGSTITNNIDICDNVTIGAQAFVNKTIFEEGIYVGIPARHLKNG